MAYPKCCKHCQDYKKCDEHGKCCEFCDYNIGKKCIYTKSKKPTALSIAIEKSDSKFSLDNFRGDDYGIDDYAEYETSDT